MSQRLLLITAWLFVVLNLWPVLAALRKRPPSDFMIYYFGGKLAASGQISQLYHRPAYEPLIAELRARGEFISPVNARIGAYYFVRPAFAAYFYVPFTWLPFRAAAHLAVWANVALLGVLLWKLPVWFPFPDFFGVGLFRACLALFPPFVAAIGYGQDALLLTLLAAAAIHFILQGRDAWAGLLLAACAFKPHLIVALPLALAAGRRWRVLIWFCGAGFLLATFSFAAVGPVGVREWFDLLGAPSTDYMPEDMGNLRALSLRFGFPASLVGVVLALVCFLTVLRCASLAAGLSAAILASLLLSPHTYRYDFSLMALCALLASRPAPRYLLLLPWLSFYPREDLLPMVLLALGYLAILTWSALRKDHVGGDSRCAPAPPGG